MTALRIGAGAAALLLLTACAAVGPNAVTPERAMVKAPEAQGPFVGAASPAVAETPVPDSWWRLYDDPALDGLIAKALSANADLRVAAANLARARAAAGEAEAAGGLSASVSAAAERAQESAEAYLQPRQLPVEYLADAGLRVSYQIDLVGRLKRAAEAARADADAVEAARDLARVSVVADVAGAYVEVCSAGQELEAARGLLDLQARSLEITRRLVAAGRDSAIDDARALGQADQARAALPGLEARRRVALYRLAVLTGVAPAAFPRALEACAAPPRLTRPIPIGDGAALLRRRPDVRLAERGLAASTARIGVAMGELYPSVSLGLGAGSTGILGDLGAPAANRWNVGPLISWTVPMAGARARIRQADAAADAALARFDSVVLNALRETETGLTTYAHDLDREAALRSARDQAQLARAQTQRLYRAGRSPYVAGLESERALAVSEAALAVSQGQVAADQVRLFLALGGGWRDEGLPARPDAKAP